MDEQRISQLADLVDQLHEPGFNMRAWLNVPSPPVTRVIDDARELGGDEAAIRFAQDCRTIACIAGWTVIAFGDRGDLEDPASIRANARRLLDMDDDQAEALFWPQNSAMELATPQDCAAVLRHLAQTGQVCWPFAPYPTQYDYRCPACGQHNHDPVARHCPGDERDDTTDLPF